MGWIDDLSTAWDREYPDLDTASFPPMVRLARLSVLIEGFQQAVLAPFELSSGDPSMAFEIPALTNPARILGGLTFDQASRMKSTNS